jgi:hypothetical protein
MISELGENEDERELSVQTAVLWRMASPHIYAWRRTIPKSAEGTLPVLLSYKKRCGKGEFGLEGKERLF